MPLQPVLYQPAHWLRAGNVLCLTDCAKLTTYEIALLIPLKRATFITSSSQFGDSMSDDHSVALRLVTPPASEPITLSSAKAYLRIEHSADDEAITRAISAVRQAAEHYMRLALLPQTWDYIVANPCPDKIALPYVPAQSITSITLTTESGTSTTMNAANYRLAVDGAAVLFTPSVSIEKMTIRYVAGMAASASDVPAGIVQGLLHHLSVMMETRDGLAPMPVQSLACYQPYRRVSL